MFSDYIASFDNLFEFTTRQHAHVQCKNASTTEFLEVLIRILTLLLLIIVIILVLTASIAFSSVRIIVGQFCGNCTRFLLARHARRRLFNRKLHEITRERHAGETAINRTSRGMVTALST